jgi:exosortase/archaeosortase
MMNRISFGSALLHTDGSWVVGVVATVIVSAGDDGKTVVASISVVIGAWVVVGREVGRSVVAFVVVVSTSVVGNVIVDFFSSVVV